MDAADPKDTVTEQKRKPTDRAETVALTAWRIGSLPRRVSNRRLAHVHSGGESLNRGPLQSLPVLIAHPLFGLLWLDQHQRFQDAPDAAEGFLFARKVRRRLAVLRRVLFCLCDIRIFREALRDFPRQRVSFLPPVFLSQFELRERALRGWRSCARSFHKDHPRPCDRRRKLIPRRFCESHPDNR
jgi:hypothetical protein